MKRAVSRTPSSRHARLRANALTDAFERRIDRLARNLPFPHDLPRAREMPWPECPLGYRSIGALKPHVLTVFCAAGFTYNPGESGHGVYRLSKCTALPCLNTWLCFDVGTHALRFSATWGTRYSSPRGSVFPAGFALPVNRHDDLAYPLTDLPSWRRCLENAATSVACVESLLLPRLIRAYAVGRTQQSRPRPLARPPASRRTRT